jgi:hypothetical protein
LRLALEKDARFKTRKLRHERWPWLGPRIPVLLSISL